MRETRRRRSKLCRALPFLPAAALFVCLPARAQVTIKGNLTVLSGTAPQTWYGLVGVLWGNAPQSVSGSLTIAFRSNGAACVLDSECGSGHCSGGICCNSVCSDGCDSCSVAGAIGTCTTFPAGRVCRAAQGLCGVNAVCDGVSRTCPVVVGVQPAGTVCLQPRGPCEAPARCDGSTQVCPSTYLAQGTACGPNAVCSGSSPYCLDSAGNPAGFEGRIACF